MYYEIIFCIFACDTIDRYKREIHKIEETWGKTAINLSYKLLFFLGESGPLLGDNYVHFENVSNDYLSAADKQYLGIKYAMDNFDFRFLYVCGTDTFVLVRTLKYYLSEVCDDSAIIIGGHGDTRFIADSHVHFFSGGPGFLLSKATVNLIYPQLEFVQSEWRDLCVATDRLTLIPACDLSICFFLKQLDVQFLNVHNRFFSCNYLGYSCGYKCCVDSVDINTMIACHNMSLEDFDILQQKIS
jgi:hypothetical protein